MFEQLFDQPHALARHQNSPLADERRRFLIHLAQRGEPRNQLRSVASVLLRVIHRLDLVNRQDECISREEIVEKFKKGGTTIPSAVRWLQFLDRFEQPLPIIHPYAKEIDAFVVYMRCERGASEWTIKGRTQFLRRFFAQIPAPSRRLCDFTVAQIDEALLAMVHQKGYARGSVCTWSSTLRAFFRYAATRSWCQPALADAIRRPRQFTQALLPSGPTWDDIRRLLKMTEGNQPFDIRDRAILMLLAIYGLRTGEVCRLTLEDFDWEHELLTVISPKTRRTRCYPLVRSVGDAVLRYLQELRPQSPHREMFLSMRRPVRPLRSALYDIVNRRLKLLDTSLRHYGPHALRHSCAVRLLAKGMSLKEIGDHLGHRHPDTTRIYAKVDLAGLRQVANFDLGGLL